MPGYLAVWRVTFKIKQNGWCFNLKFCALGLTHSLITLFFVFSVKWPCPSVKSPTSKNTNLGYRSFKTSLFSVCVHRYLILTLIMYLAANNLKTPDRSALPFGFCCNSAEELAMRIFFTVHSEEKRMIHLILNLKAHLTWSILDDLDDYVLQVAISLLWLERRMPVSSRLGKLWMCWSQWSVEERSMFFLNNFTAKSVIKLIKRMGPTVFFCQWP